MERRRRTFGDRHPNTLASINNLAVLLQQQGHFDRAAQLFEEVVSTRKEVLGEAHPDTLTALNNLAGNFKATEQLDAAKKLYVETLEQRGLMLGSKHPNTLATINNLAVVYNGQGKWEQAFELYKEGISASEEVLGMHHPNTLNAKSNAGNLALRRGGEVLGNLHPDTATNYAQLGGTPFCRRTVRRRRAFVRRGMGWPETSLLSFHSLSKTRLQLGNVMEAQELLFSAVSGLKHPREEDEWEEEGLARERKRVRKTAHDTIILQRENRREQLEFYTKHLRQDGSGTEVGELSMSSIPKPNVAWPMSSSEPFVFLSHHGPEAKEEIARPTRWFLKKYLKIKSFMDDEDMKISDAQMRSLLENAYRCTHAVVILSPSFRKSRWCVKELNTFVGRSKKRQDVVPVMW